MTFQEFKAWLDGFSDAMGDTPTPEQWAKIKAKMAQVREPQSYAPNTFTRIPLPRVPAFYETDKTPRDPMWGLPSVTCGQLSPSHPDIRCTNEVRQ